MVARACKHILRSLTRAAAPLDYPALISHFFNCLLGAAVESSPTPIIAPTFEDNVVERSWAELTPSIVQEIVVKEIEARYRYTLASDYVVQSIRPETLLREICLRFGIQLNLKDYHFTASTTPVIEAATTTKKGKKSITKLQDVAQVVTFKPEDVLNIYPITKSNTHRVSSAVLLIRLQLLTF